MIMELDNNKIMIKKKLPSGRSVVFWRPAYLFYLPKKDWAVIYWDYRVVVLVRRRAVDPAWLAGTEYRYFRPADSWNLVLPVLEGAIRLSALEKEIRCYLKSNTVYYEGSSIAAEVLNYQKAIRELCREDTAKCRP